MRWLIVTARQQPIQLPDGSKAILEAAALLGELFSVCLLIDLRFSADALDPLSDNVSSASRSQPRHNLRIPNFEAGFLARCHGQENGLCVSKLENRTQHRRLED
jgi:hypothetical protein